MENTVMFGCYVSGDDITYFMEGAALTRFDDIKETIVNAIFELKTVHRILAFNGLQDTMAQLDGSVIELAYANACLDVGCGEVLRMPSNFEVKLQLKKLTERLLKKGFVIDPEWVEVIRSFT